MDPTWAAGFLAEHDLPLAYGRTLEVVAAPLAARIVADVAGADAPLLVGICGPQAAGKSTLTAALAGLMQAQGLSVAVLSIDDLYLSHAARQRLGREIHPLLATRGPPGTHDVGLGLGVLDALSEGQPAALPRFDKASDDLIPASAWPQAPAKVNVMLFEGWCVGARPQPAAALIAPANDLEARRDPDGRWRRHVNDSLAGPYQELFRLLDRLILLQAPGFEVVAAWRQEQERKLRMRLAAEGAAPARSMSDDEVLAFIQLYERLTTHILATMPAYADAIVPMALDRTMRPPQWAARPRAKV
ncbi:kinase [Phenylobacterium sp.]|uniref:kinase n=1 Tax=Phenylobacterium sp. TaxID=1871053 RepID=UPI00272FABFF|nr:kinase [Phenylobacterium sp.]MDP1618401.1 kinase [Phenylobacterium sp.]MDP1987381.1 kinase [Phenylobacterium sp.]